MEPYDFPFSWEWKIIPTDFSIFFRGVGIPPTSSWFRKIVLLGYCTFWVPSGIFWESCAFVLSMIVEQGGKFQDVPYWALSLVHIWWKHGVTASCPSKDQPPTNSVLLALWVKCSICWSKWGSWLAKIYIYIYHHSDHSLVNYNNVTTPNALQLGVASASASPLRRGPKPVRSLDGSTKQAESLGVGMRNQAEVYMYINIYIYTYTRMIQQKHMSSQD